MICVAKHTKYQPSDNEWNCPHCGADNENFYVDAYPDEADSDCEKLHDNDYVVCGNCKGEFTGKSVARVILAKLNMVKCPHCKGTGYIKK